MRGFLSFSIHTNHSHQIKQMCIFSMLLSSWLCIAWIHYNSCPYWGYTALSHPILFYHSDLLLELNHDFWDWATGLRLIQMSYFCLDRTVNISAQIVRPVDLKIHFFSVWICSTMSFFSYALGQYCLKHFHKLYFWEVCDILLTAFILKNSLLVKHH